MLVKELLALGYLNQQVEIANPTDYYFGKLMDVPEWLGEYEVKYIYAGLADTQGPHGENYHDTLCIDAEPIKDTKVPSNLFTTQSKEFSDCLIAQSK